MLKFVRHTFVFSILILLFLFVLPNTGFLQAPGGAIGFKILPNPERLSPLDWYKQNIPIVKQGDPKEIIIDGYQAVEDGRSVYVNAANLSGEVFYKM